MKNLVELTSINDDPRFGNLTIMYDPDDPLNKVMKKTKQSETLEEHQQTIDQARCRRDINHPNILRLLEIENNQSELIASVYFEFPDTTLDILSLSNEEVILMFHDILNAIVYLQSNKMVHGDIRSDYITFSVRENCYKLLDRLGDFSNPIQCQLNNINNYRAIYMSPIIFNELMKQSKKIKQNSYKSECFALGMNVLGYFVDPEIVQEMYDFDSCEFNIKLFEEILIELAHKEFDSISKVFIDYLTKNVLIIDEKERLNPQLALEELLKIPELNKLLNLYPDSSNQENLIDRNTDKSKSVSAKTVYYNPFEFVDKTSVQARNIIKAEIYGSEVKHPKMSNQEMSENINWHNNSEKVFDPKTKLVQHANNDVDINKFIMSNPQNISNIKNALLSSNTKEARESEEQASPRNDKKENDLILVKENSITKTSDNPKLNIVSALNLQPQDQTQITSNSHPSSKTEKVKEPEALKQNKGEPSLIVLAKEITEEPHKPDISTQVETSSSHKKHIDQIISLENINNVHNQIANYQEEGFEPYGNPFVSSPPQIDKIPSNTPIYQGLAYNAQYNVSPFNYHQYGSFPHNYGPHPYPPNFQDFNGIPENQPDVDDDMGQYLQSLGITVDQELNEERFEDKLRNLYANTGISAEELIYKEAHIEIPKPIEPKVSDKKTRIKLSEFLRETTRTERETVNSDLKKQQVNRINKDFHDEYNDKSENGNKDEANTENNYQYQQKRLSISNKTYQPSNDFNPSLIDSNQTLDENMMFLNQNINRKRQTDSKIRISDNFVFVNKHSLKQTDSLPDYTETKNQKEEPTKEQSKKKFISTQPKNYFVHKPIETVKETPKETPAIEVIKEDNAKPTAQSHQLTTIPQTHQYADSLAKKDSLSNKNVKRDDKSSLIENLKKFSVECKLDSKSIEAKNLKLRSKSPLIVPCKKEIIQIKRMTANDDQNIPLFIKPSVQKDSSRKLLTESQNENNLFGQPSAIVPDESKLAQPQKIVVQNQTTNSNQNKMHSENAKSPADNFFSTPANNNTEYFSSDKNLQTTNSYFDSAVIYNKANDFFSNQNLPPKVVSMAHNRIIVKQENPHQAYNDNINLYTNFSNFPNHFVKNQGDKNQTKVVIDQKSRSTTPNQKYVKIVPGKQLAETKVEILIPKELEQTNNVTNSLFTSNQDIDIRGLADQSPPKAQPSIPKSSNQNIGIVPKDHIINISKDSLRKEHGSPKTLVRTDSKEENIINKSPINTNLYEKLNFDSNFKGNNPQIISTFPMPNTHIGSKAKPDLKITGDNFDMQHPNKDSVRVGNPTIFTSKVTTPRKQETPILLYNPSYEYSNKDLKLSHQNGIPILYNHQHLNKNKVNHKIFNHDNINLYPNTTNSTRNSHTSAQKHVYIGVPQIVPPKFQTNIENEYYFYDEPQEQVLNQTGVPPLQNNNTSHYVQKSNPQTTIEIPTVPQNIPNSAMFQRYNTSEKVMKISNSAQEGFGSHFPNPVQSHKNVSVQQFPTLYQPQLPKIIPQNSKSQSQTVWLNAQFQNQQSGIQHIVIPSGKIPQTFIAPPGMIQQVYMPPRPNVINVSNRPESSRHPLNKPQ